MSAETLPLVQYAMARPFAEALVGAGIDADALLGGVGLAPEALYIDDIFVPAQSWCDFVAAASEATSNPAFGFQVGAETVFAALPNVRVLAFEDAALGELLTALVVGAQRLTTLARYSSSVDGQSAILRTRRTFTPKHPPAQIDAFFVGFMLRILRLCTGDRWSPKALSVMVSDPATIPVAALPRSSLLGGGREGRCSSCRRIGCSCAPTASGGKHGCKRSLQAPVSWRHFASASRSVWTIRASTSRRLPVSPPGRSDHCNGRCPWRQRRSAPS